MKFSSRSLLSATLFAAALVAASQQTIPAEETAVPLAAELLGGLPESRLLELLRTIEESPYGRERFDARRRTEALLLGLLSQPGTGVRLSKKPRATPGKGEAKAGSGLIVHRFPQAIFLRVTADGDGDGDGDGASLRESVKSANDAETRALPVILDLRHGSEGALLRSPSALAGLFLPEGTPLYSVMETPERPVISSGEPIFSDARCLVLMDERTSGAGEILAEVLRERTGAVLIGEPSAGARWLTAVLEIDKNTMLEYPIAFLKREGEGGDVRTRLKPDVLVEVGATGDDRAAAAFDSAGVAGLIGEEEAPRFDEAALVAGVNPEYVRFDEEKEGGRRDLSKKSPDELLKAALDVADTMRVYSEVTQGAAGK